MNSVPNAHLKSGLQSPLLCSLTGLPTELAPQGGQGPTCPVTAMSLASSCAWHIGGGTDMEGGRGAGCHY